MQDKKTIKVLMLGDLMGTPGKAMFQKHAQPLREKYKADFVVVNGENSNKNGRGITPKIVNFLKKNGADVITTGNHIWHQRDIIDAIDDYNDVLRPANFPAECPGSGVTVVKCGNVPVGVVNLQGRIFMREQLSCPFRMIDTLVQYLKSKTNIILVDFHAETTSEKLGMGIYLDGKVSLVVGTHTHVPTNDARIFPKGTGYITDLGMSGSYNSMIGMKPESVLPSMINQMPSRFMVDHRGPFIMSGVSATIDTETGKALAIEPVKVIDEDLDLQGEDE